MAGKMAACGVRTASGRDREQAPAVAGRVRGPALPRQHRLEPARDVAIVVEPQDLRLGQFLGEAGAVTLGQAACGHDLRTARSRAEQLVDRVLLGRLDKATGVDQDHVGVVIGQGPARGLQPRRELLRVDLIARAA